MTLYKVEDFVERMKAEILADVADGTVPADVKSFSELHNYVDANCYGGFCKDEIYNGLWDAFPRNNGEAATEMPEGMLDFLNDCQNAVHLWIESGGITSEI